MKTTLNLFKHLLIGTFVGAWVFLVLDQIITRAKVRGIHPIGTEAVYLEGEACTVNLTPGSSEDFCSFEMPINTPPQDFIPEVNKCIEGRTNLPGYVLPSFNQCLRLHMVARNK
jgi:hypothetical protein